MVWGFCYLRIFKKMHSISGRSLINISISIGIESKAALAQLCTI
jgi:hypothetical protein